MDSSKQQHLYKFCNIINVFRLLSLSHFFIADHKLLNASVDRSLQNICSLSVIMK